jgi:hypothetical protein
MTKMEELYYRALVDKHGTNFKVDFFPRSNLQQLHTECRTRADRSLTHSPLGLCVLSLCRAGLQAMERDIKLNYNQLTETKLERRGLFYIEAYRNPQEERKRMAEEMRAMGGKRKATQEADEAEDEDEDEDDEEEEEDDEEDGEEDDEGDDGEEDEDEDGDE